MNNYPDFSAQGYQVIRELGHNRAAGRLTYLATQMNTGAAVVIKQFQFARVSSNWSDYKVFETEVQALKQIQHSQIPRYLDSFESPTGLYLVQEYKKANSLAQYKYFNLQDIQQIAISVLEILVYLQQQSSPIIHRDIKPENILVDRTKKTIEVYLVDFGFAHLGNREVGASSVVKGTLGFMPPEQIFNRQLTEASDLYSLGVTLIALLMRTKSTEIGNLIDESFCFKLKSRLSHLNPKFVVWLEKMVNPKLKHRFSNAEQALQAIKTISITDDRSNYLGTGSQLKVVIIVIILLGVLGVNFPNIWRLIFRDTREFKATSINETIVAPFASGPKAVTSSNAYSGLINIVVSGRGQAAGTQFSDAFYLLTNTGSLQPANEFGLFINGQSASNLFYRDRDIQEFSPRHTYSFQINAPGGRLTFGVGDTFTTDNTGSFTITISPAVSAK